MADPARPVQDAWIDPVWGQWVHDSVAARPATYTVGLTGTGNISVPTMLGGTITIPTVPYDRVLILSMTMLLTISTGTGMDFFFNGPGGVDLGRFRHPSAAPAGSNGATMHRIHPANATGVSYGVKAFPIALPTQFTLGGGADLNWLQITAIPIRP